MRKLLTGLCLAPLFMATTGMAQDPSQRVLIINGERYELNADQDASDALNDYKTQAPSDRRRVYEFRDLDEAQIEVLVQDAFTVVEEVLAVTEPHIEGRIIVDLDPEMDIDESANLREQIQARVERELAAAERKRAHREVRIEMREHRRDTREQAREARHAAREARREARDIAREHRHEARERAREVRNQVREIVRREARSQAHDSAREAHQMAREIRAQVRESLRHAHLAQGEDGFEHNMESFHLRFENTARHAEELGRHAERLGRRAEVMGLRAGIESLEESLVSLREALNNEYIYINDEREPMTDAHREEIASHIPEIEENLIEMRTQLAEAEARYEGDLTAIEEVSYDYEWVQTPHPEHHNIRVEQHDDGRTQVWVDGEELTGDALTDWLNRAEAERLAGAPRR